MDEQALGERLGNWSKNFTSFGRLFGGAVTGGVEVLEGALGTNVYGEKLDTVDRILSIASGAASIGANVGLAGIKIGGSVGAAGKGAVTSLNPNEVRFSQNTVSYNKIERGTSNKYTYDDLVSSMKKNGWAGEPVDVIKMPDGKFTSMDNTRIRAAREADIGVKANIHNFNDPLSSTEKARFTEPKKNFYPTTWGEAIQGRIDKQSGQFGKLNPNGSNELPRLTGVPKN